MANTKISALTAAVAVGLTDTVPIVQGGVTKRTTVTDIQTALTGKADVLAQATIGAGTTAITHATHANRPCIVNEAAATTGTFAATATSGALAGDSFYLRNTGAGTWTASGTITAAAGFKLTAGPNETFTADYDSVDDAWYSTTLALSTTEAMADSWFAMVVPQLLTTVTLGAIGSSSPSVLDTCVANGNAVSTDLMGYRPRVRYAAAATAINRVAGLGFAKSLQLNQGGLYNASMPLVIQAAASDAGTGSFFLGLTSNLLPNFTATEPSAFTTQDMVGFGWDSPAGTQNTNGYIFYNDNSGAMTVIDLGASFTKTQGQLYRVVISKKEDGTEIYIKVVKIATSGATNTESATYTLTTNIPRSTIQLYPCVARSSMAQSSTLVTIDFGGTYWGRLA